MCVVGRQLCRALLGTAPTVENSDLWLPEGCTLTGFQAALLNGPPTHVIMHERVQIGRDMLRVKRKDTGKSSTHRYFKVTWDVMCRTRATDTNLEEGKEVRIVVDQSYSCSFVS